MHSYPIWNEVEACNYGSNKSWGSKDTMSLTQRIGSSASNSHKFVQIVTTKRPCTLKDGSAGIIFRFSADGVILKETIFSTNRRGNADELISSRTKLKRIKSLI